MRAQIINRDTRLAIPIRGKVILTDKFKNISVAGFILRQQHDLIRLLHDTGIIAAQAIFIITAQPVGRDIKLTANNRLDTFFPAGLRELQGAKHITRIGDGDGGHVEFFAPLNQVFNLKRPF